MAESEDCVLLIVFGILTVLQVMQITIAFNQAN